MSLPQSCILVLLTMLIGITGCEHIGPKTIMDDRIPYNEAVVNTWKQQTLLNIVRLRYIDVPEFIDVPSVVNGYEQGHTTTGAFDASVFPHNIVSDNLAFGLGVSRTLSDRPTVTYTPQTDSAFTRNLVQPIPPASILNLIENGSPADVVMDLTVESINGVRNRQVVAGSVQDGDPEFQRVLQIMRKAQASGQVSLRFAVDADKKDTDLLMSIQDRDIDPALAEELAELRRILRLAPDRHEFKIVVGMLPSADDEIAFRTRSVMRIMTYLSLNVEVPPDHLADGRAPDLGDTGSIALPQLTVHSGVEQPCDAFAAVCYQGRWFWIDQSDFHSKRSISYLKVLLALADTETRKNTPTLTIRAN